MKRYSEGLNAHKVEYPADFATPLEDRPRKVGVVGVRTVVVTVGVMMNFVTDLVAQVAIAEPPESKEASSSGVQGKTDRAAFIRDPADLAALDTPITLTIKSLKPSLSITVQASLTDSIAHLKELVAKSSTTAPSPDAQRLLLKGKALTDTKLLKEYDIQDGATVHLMFKPSAPVEKVTPSTSSSAIPPSSPTPPALTITTSLAGGEEGESHKVTDADIDIPPSGPGPQVSSAAFHQTISDPKLWQQLQEVCSSNFAYEDDADAAWEIFLTSMKGRLSAGEAAKIRDVVGIRGERRIAS